MDEIVDLPFAAEGVLIANRTALTLHQMLSVKTLQMPSTREQAKMSIRHFHQEVLALEEARHEPHTWRHIHELCTKRAAYELLCWRIFPIADLPQEILEHIFMEGIATLSAESVFKGRLNLMSVCHHWFITILNAPRLWQTLYINTHPPFARTRLCIERAKQHQLKIYVDLRDFKWKGLEEDNGFSSEDSDQLMVFLAPYFSRINLFVVLCDTWSVMLSVMRALEPMDTPRHLKRLELHRSGRPYVHFANLPQPATGFSVPARLFGNTILPSLTHLMLNGVFVDFSGFRNLRILELAKMPVEHMPHFDALVEVLVSSPLLERLHFNGTCARLVPLSQKGSKYEHWKPIHLPHLMELLIINLNSVYAIFATNIIDAPNVRHLAIGSMPDAEDAQLFVMHLIDRYPLVKILTVENMMCDHIGANALFFMSMPLLRYLKMGNVRESFYNALLLGESDEEGYMSLSDTPMLCPQLEGLHITDWDSLGADNIKRLWAKRLELEVPFTELFIPIKELPKLKEEDVLWARQTHVFNQVPPNCRPELNDRYWVDEF